MFEKLKAVVDDNLAMGIPGADILVYKDGKEIYRYFAGTASHEGAPMTGKERYNIYSCSKFITCTAALMLYEQGKLGLDDKVSKYLPEYGSLTVLEEDGSVRPAKTEMTVKHLFTMMGGLTYNVHYPAIMKVLEETEGRAPTREVIRALASEPLQYDPGAHFLYGLDHDVLACIVEVISGMRFGEFVKQNIFDPLGMKDTSYCVDDDELDTLCDQYDCTYEKGGLNATYHLIGKNVWRGYKVGTEYESGGAGCVSTVCDYMKFLEGLRTGKLISQETLALMASEQLPPDKLEGYWIADAGYGYGLGVRCPAAGSDRHDFGWGGAAGAYPMIDLELGISAFYAQHVLDHPSDEMTKIPAILREIYGEN